MTKILDFVAGRTPAQLYESYLVPGFFAPFAEQLADYASPGRHYLDVACGTGIVSRTIAEKCDEDVTIKAVDVVPLMIDEAKKRASSPAIEYHVAPADALPFAEASFDTALCQQGLQFFPDQKKAVHEINRTLKPGGCFFASIWPSADEASPVFHSFADAVGRHLGDDLLPLGPFAFGGEEKLELLARETGFAIETLERRTLTTVLPSIRELVLFDILFLGRPGPDGALQPVLAPDDPAGDEIVEKIIFEMTSELTRFIGSDGRLVSPATTLFLAARK